jgi:SAM-dependent methyltransferase
MSSDEDSMTLKAVEDLYKGTRGKKYFRERIGRQELSTQRYLSVPFQRHVAPNDTVVDFGCGTGAMLRSLDCAARIGVEINEPSLAAALVAGIEVHRDIGEIADDSADVVMSHHALEHTAQPFRIVSEFYRILKPQGTLIVIVPCEPGRRRAFRRWREQLDMHLYSWNPLSLGNLVSSCGFTVVESLTRTNGLSHFNRWLLPVPPIFAVAEHLFGRILGRFNTLCVATKD